MLNCILIDDDRDEIDIFSMAVSELDFGVVCTGYNDCREALEILSKTDSLPDCIFLDSNLSGINGKECLEKIKATPRLIDIPVIIFSGLISDAEKTKYKELGAYDCIIKPNSLKDLEAQLNGFFCDNFKMKSRASS